MTVYVIVFPSDLFWDLRTNWGRENLGEHMERGEEPYYKLSVWAKSWIHGTHNLITEIIEPFEIKLCKIELSTSLV